MLADTLLVLEGTYPYVRGGVSSWVAQFIQHRPDLKFALIFLGSERKAYPREPFYNIPPNVISLDQYYLFEKNASSSAQPTPTAGGAMGVPLLSEMHSSFKEGGTCSPKALHLKTYQSSKTGFSKNDFLHSPNAWKFICEEYQKNADESSFIDYFWAVRNMHQPLWQLAQICETAPRAKRVHSISTGYAGFLGALIKVSQSIPYLVSEHGIYTLERQIDLLFKEWQKGDSDLTSKLWIRFFEVLGKYAYQEASKIVSLFSGYQKVQIELGADPQKTLVIPNGVDLKAGQNLLQARPQKNEKIVCFLGRIVSIKDVKTFIRSINLLRNTMPHIKAWIVGSEEEQPDYANECRQLVHSLSLENIIEFKGQQNINHILPFVDVLVLTSISEGLPLVILEAFSAGIPTVATNVGACHELINGKDHQDEALGHSGKIVGINNPQATAEALAELLQDITLWEKAQKTALKRVETYYNKELMWDRYQDLYQQLT